MLAILAKLSFSPYLPNSPVSPTFMGPLIALCFAVLAILAKLSFFPYLPNSPLCSLFCHFCCCVHFWTYLCKETLIRHEIPDSPWQKIATDLFTFKNKEYLVTVCYRSNFWEVDRLYNTNSSTVSRSRKLIWPDTAYLSSWSQTMALSLSPTNLENSLKAGASNTQQPLPTTAKPMASAKRL